MPDTTLTGPYINYGRSLPVTLKLGLGGNIWIVGVKDTTKLKIVKIQITGPTTYNWIGTRWHTSNGACIASFTKDCFKGTELSSDKYPVSLQAVEAKFAKLDGDWVIVEDHFFVDKRRQGEVWSFNSELGVFGGNAITQTGENTFTTKSDLIYQYEYYPDMVQDGGATRYNKDMIKWWYNLPNDKYFWFARQAPRIYYIMAQGSCCCPTHNRILTQNDCDKAHESLGLKRTSKWTGKTNTIPGGCAWRDSDSHNFHWNSATVGSARNDMVPICREAQAGLQPSNGCPTGLQPNSTGKCPGSGLCCTASWSATQSGRGVAQVLHNMRQRCASAGGSWIPLNYASNAYTCEMPKLGYRTGVEAACHTKDFSHIRDNHWSEVTWASP